VGADDAFSGEHEIGEAAMKKILILGALVALAGCQSLGGPGSAVQVGKKKFEIAYSGGHWAAIDAAQSFCVGRGFSHAAATQVSGGRVVFYCLSGGETLVSQLPPGQRGRIFCMNAPNGAQVCGRLD
jgi:hypothetical protein